MAPAFRSTPSEPHARSFDISVTRSEHKTRFQSRSRVCSPFNIHDLDLRESWTYPNHLQGVAFGLNQRPAGLPLHSIEIIFRCMPPFRKAGSVRNVGWFSFHELWLYLIVPPATATGFTGTVVVTKAVTWLNDHDTNTVPLLKAQRGPYCAPLPNGRKCMMIRKL